MSVPVLGEFWEVFPNEFRWIPLKREIDCDIDLLPDTKPISIPPYWMEQMELKELKEQLKDFLDKDFIQPSLYLRGSQVLFVKKKYGLQCVSNIDNWKS